jgi:PAS domain S-box-containing protein
MGSCCHRLGRSLYEANPAACFALDEQGTIIACSQYACEQLKYSVEELLTRSFLTLSFSEDRSKVSTLIASCLLTPGELAHHEGRKLRRDGSLFWVSERARAVPDDDGEPVVRSSILAS